MRSLFALTTLVVAVASASATEYHVAKDGNDRNPGTPLAPLRTIQRAADLAQPGDTVTVHRGLYRERVNPPRGGPSDSKRIVYRAAPGEKVEIRGSEVVKGWVRDRGNVWKAIVPNAMFGSFNPYGDLIRGDWFDPRGRAHHTGAVYLDGRWLAEAAKLEDLYDPVALMPTGGTVLLNVAWLKPTNASARTPATAYAEHRGVQNAPCDEGGDCIGWIERGDWVRYDRFDFGQTTREVELRVASATEGGVIELRLDSPTGPMIGSCNVPHTGGWQTWVSVTAKVKPTRGVRTLCLVFRETDPGDPIPGLWFAEVGDRETTIWARFPNADPNRRQVEINVRRTVFYPDAPGRDWITVRGFTMRHAATNWAPPTAEQVGLIGTHWSRGWIIENCTISHSVCSGIALGKHGDEFDNTSANTAEGYVKTIERGLARGWNRATIGNHIVRNNAISHCEQAGIVGSLGAAFCTISGNTIHDIHMRRLFSGAEMAGIKFHGAIDTVIEGNRIYRTCLGLWLDWMAQGTRVTRNLFHGNANDLFLEVNHGPFVVDNNLFLSATNLLDVSQGGAFAHNLFVGRLMSMPDMGRETPYHPAHSTAIAGLARIGGGGHRFLNNIFVGPVAPVNADADPQWNGGHGLWIYDFRTHPLVVGGNVYYRGARPYAAERGIAPVAVRDPVGRRTIRPDSVTLDLAFGPELASAKAALVTSDVLGRSRVSGLPFENADGSPIQLDRDYFGIRRKPGAVLPGPFAEVTKSTGNLAPRRR